MMSLRDILGIALLFCFLIVAGNLAGDPGVGWHLRAGEEMLKSGSVLYHDPFLTTESPRVWTDDQWLSDIIFWKLFSVGGMGFLQAAILGLAVLTYAGILGRVVEEKIQSPLLTFLLLAALSPLVSLQWFVRPVVFSFVLFSLTLVASRTLVRLGSGAMKKGVLWTIPLMFCLWANLHPGFPLGLFVFGLAVLFRLWVGDAAEKREVFLLGAASVSSTLLNPYGMGLHKSILALVSDPFFMQLNNEWKSPDFFEPVFYPFGLFLLILLSLLGKKSGEGELFDRVVFAAFSAFALLERRYLPYCGIAAALALSGPIQRSFQSGYLSRGSLGRMIRIIPVRGSFLSGKSYLPRGILLAWIALLAFFYRSGPTIPFPGKLPEGVLAALAAGPKGRIFHSPDLGGYLIWEREKTGGANIDDRNQLCAREEYEEYFDIALASPGWRTLLSKYSWAILDPSDPLRFVIALDGWREVVKGNGEATPRVSLWFKESGDQPFHFEHLSGPT